MKGYTMKQLNKTNTYNVDKGVTKTTSVKHFFYALVTLTILSSMAYTAFITTVGVGGMTNFYLALPSMVAILGTLLTAVYQAAKNFK